MCNTCGENRTQHQAALGPILLIGGISLAAVGAIICAVDRAKAPA